MQACQEILEQASPKSVASIALAQTWHPSDDDPISDFYRDLEERIEENYLYQCIEIEEKYQLEMQELSYWREEEFRALQELQNLSNGG